MNAVKQELKNQRVRVSAELEQLCHGTHFGKALLDFLRSEYEAEKESLISEHVPGDGRLILTGQAIKLRDLHDLVQRWITG